MFSARRRRCHDAQFAQRCLRTDVVGIYHCYNRCSQRAFLCGFDPLTQTDFSHRKDWIRNGLKSLAASMAVDVLDYAVMDNHFPVVLRNRPDLVAGWSHEEVVGLPFTLR